MPIVLSNQPVDRAVGQSAANTAARSERSLADPIARSGLTYLGCFERFGDCLFAKLPQLLSHSQLIQNDQAHCLGW